QPITKKVLSIFVCPRIPVGCPWRAFPNLNPIPHQTEEFLTQTAGRSSPGAGSSAYRTYSRKRPDGGAVHFAETADLVFSRFFISSGSSVPRPVSTSVPTILRTIFHKKCEALKRNRIKSSCVAISQSVTSTIVEVCCAGDSVNEVKS